MTRLAAAHGIVDSPRVFWEAASRGHHTQGLHKEDLDTESLNTNKEDLNANKKGLNTEDLNKKKKQYLFSK